MILNSKTSQNKRTRNKVPVCGTYSGYCFHLKNKTEICQPCRDARNAYRRAHQKKNPQARRASDICYQESHPGQRNKYDQKYRDNNREKTRTATLKWNKEHPEKMREKSRKRRAIKLQNGYEPYTETQVIEIYGATCHLCTLSINLELPRAIGKEDGWELALHIDHVIPIIAGGPDTLENVRPSHAICNMKKGSKMTNEFEPELDPDLFEEEAVELDDYDDHAWDEDELEEEEK